MVWKRACRWSGGLLLVGIITAGGLLLARDRLLQALARTQLEKHTGMKADFATFHTGVAKPSLTIHQLSLANPTPASGLISVTAPELYLELSFRRLFQRQLHFPRARLSVAEVVIAQPKGAPNELAVSLESWNSTVRAFSSETAPILGFRFAGIDTLQISLGKVKLRSPAALNSTEVDLGLKDRVLTNVHSAEELSNLVLKALIQNGVTIISAGDR